MQLLIRGLQGRTQVVQVEAEACFGDLLAQLEIHDPAVGHAYLCREGRRLKDEDCVGEIASDGDTLHATWGLPGGKGGFGNLLRGQGRDGKVTTNFDACRDLSGRRLRHKLGEEKMAAWAADAKERELERTALEHIKNAERAKRRDAELAKHEAALAEDREHVANSILSAVSSGLSKRNAGASGVSSGLIPPKRQKRPALTPESDSEDDDDDSDSDSDSDSDMPFGRRGAAAPATPSPPAGSLPPKSPSSGAPSSSSPPAGTVGSDEATTSADVATTSADVATTSADVASGAGASTSRASSDDPPELVDLKAYESAAELEVLGMGELAAQLRARGMKAGGTSKERAARLWLARDTPVGALDRKHLAAKR